MQIDGYFNTRGEPVIRLDVGSSRIEVLVDTGFNGGLIIPDQLARNWISRTTEDWKSFAQLQEQRSWRPVVRWRLAGLDG